MHGRPRDRLAPRPDFKIRNVPPPPPPPKKKQINRMEKQKHTEGQGAWSGWNMVNMVGSVSKATAQKQPHQNKKDIKTPKSKPQNPESKIKTPNQNFARVPCRGPWQDPESKTKIQNATKNQTPKLQNQNSKITSQKLNGPYKTCFLIWFVCSLFCSSVFYLMFYFLMIYVYCFSPNLFLFMFFSVFCFF